MKQKSGTSQSSQNKQPAPRQDTQRRPEPFPRYVVAAQRSWPTNPADTIPLKQESGRERGRPLFHCSFPHYTADLIVSIVMRHPLEPCQSPSTDVHMSSSSPDTLFQPPHAARVSTVKGRVGVFFWAHLAQGFSFQRQRGGRGAFRHQRRLLIPSARDSVIWLALIAAQQGFSRKTSLTVFNACQRPTTTGFH